MRVELRRRYIKCLEEYYYGEGVYLVPMNVEFYE